MPTAVVTGGAGFLGSHLCDSLIARDFRVFCIDNLDTGSRQNVEHLRGENFTFINQDVTPDDGRAVPTSVRQAPEGQPLTVFGDASQTRSFCYVDDLIGGLIALAESEEHLPVNLGNPNEFTMNELADTVIRVTGSKSEIIHEALPVDDPQVRQPDITRARQLLSWKPEVQLEEGLRRMLGTFGREPVVA